MLDFVAIFLARLVVDDYSFVLAVVDQRIEFETKPRAFPISRFPIVVHAPLSFELDFSGRVEAFEFVEVVWEITEWIVELAEFRNERSGTVNVMLSSIVNTTAAVVSMLCFARGQWAFWFRNILIMFQPAEESTFFEIAELGVGP